MNSSINKNNNDDENISINLPEIPQGLSRRNALKLIAISPVAATLLASPSTIEASEDFTDHIVIVGAGAGGIMALSRIRSQLPKAKITVIAPNEVHLYQPGQVFVAAGEYDFDDIVLNNHDYIDGNAQWIKDEVATFHPEKNEIITKDEQVVHYDYLIVATGIVYHYEWIKGLRKEDIGTHGISSVYLNDLSAGTAKGATATWEWFKQLKEAAKTGTPKVLCTQPNTPIKCGGAPQKILYLSDDYLKEEELSAEFHFATNGSKLFSLPGVDKTLHEVQEGYGNITNHFRHNLIAVDVAKKEATFMSTFEVQGEYDEEEQEYDMIEKQKEVNIAYDYLHVVPPMSAPEAVVNSALAWQKGSAKGWLEVDRYTLQHRRFDNVFGIGDVCGIPMGKTGGTARHQAAVLVDNLVSAMKKEKLAHLFDGYTVCPLKVEYGKIVMAEFNYDGPAPTVGFLGIDKPRWVWWVFDKYMLLPMYKYLMLRGRM